jgi:diacylglycerol kinase (ATP)
VRARIRSLGHALNGLRVMLATEHNAWIHAVLAVVAVGLGLAFGISRLEWCAIVIVIGLVFAAEAFNTALEALADAAVPEQHEGIRVAKDAAAGAVLVAAVAAAIVGVVVFGPRLLLLVASVTSG